MEKITVYEKSTCTTCRKVVKILQENGVNFEKVNYYIKPFTKKKLKSLLKKYSMENYSVIFNGTKNRNKIAEDLLKKLNMKPSELLRKDELPYSELDFKNNSYDENEIFQMMFENPDLVQRPIVEKGKIAIIARPAEKINEIF